jgi:hypothetical protein
MATAPHSKANRAQCDNPTQSLPWVNMIALWNTIYMEAALNQLREEGHPVMDEDARRLSAIPKIPTHESLTRFSVSPRLKPQNRRMFANAPVFKARFSFYLPIPNLLPRELGQLTKKTESLL